MRFDKYDPVSGGFRAPLNAAYTGAAAAIGVGLNSSGKVVVGAGQTGVIGVICQPYDKAANDIVDVMTHGEIVEAGLAAGTTYYAHATTGVISTTVSAYRVGQTVEAGRLVVRAVPIPSTNVVGDQAAIVHLTDNSGGTANNTIAAITQAGNAGSADVGPTADAIADLAAKVNAILTTLESAGLLAP